MSKVVREDKGNLSAVLTLTIASDDYSPKLNAELNKYRKKAHMKGFRKGKTPMGFIKKMYGRAIMADVINEMLQKELTQYLTEEKLAILGQPLPVADQEEFDFDISNLQDFEFKFDIGLAPEFEIEGLSEDSVFERHAVEVDAAMIDKDLDQALLRAGTRESVEDAIEENDMLSVNAEELDGDAAKEKGWATTFSILVERVGSEELKKELLSKKKGDTFRFNVNDVELNASPEHIRKYILNVSEEDEGTEIGDLFSGTIGDVQRVQKRALDQEFFDQYFGAGTVKSEEEARSKIEENIVKHFDRQAESLLFRDFQETLLEKNQLELPHDFMNRWLRASNENVTDEQIAKEYDNFAKNLQWSLIRSKIARKFDINVGDDEIFEGFKDRIRNYFQGYGDELVILNTANRLMEDENQFEQMYQELMSDKLFEAIRSVVKIEDKKIGSEAFETIINKAREEATAANQPTIEAAPEATEEVTEDVEQ